MFWITDIFSTRELFKIHEHFIDFMNNFQTWTCFLVDDFLQIYDQFFEFMII